MDISDENLCIRDQYCKLLLEDDWNGCRELLTRMTEDDFDPQKYRKVGKNLLLWSLETKAPVDIVTSIHERSPEMINEKFYCQRNVLHLASIGEQDVFDYVFSISKKLEST